MSCELSSVDRTTPPYTPPTSPLQHLLQQPNPPQKHNCQNQIRRINTLRTTMNQICRHRAGSDTKSNTTTKTDKLKMTKKLLTT
jgi:hypothetical protein